MLSGFVAWWLAQIGAILPSAVKRIFTSPPDTIVLAAARTEEAPGWAITLREQRDGRTGALGSFVDDEASRVELQKIVTRRKRHARILLEIDGDWMLSKRLVLPLAVQRNVDRVVAYELEHETPFLPSEVYWSTTVAARDFKRGTIDVDLTLIQKKKLADILEWLTGAGVVPEAITAPPPAVRRVTIDRTRPRWSNDPVALAAAAAAAMLAIAIAMPFVKQSLALSSVEARIAALAPRAAEAQELRRRIDGAIGTGQDGGAAPLLLLDALTDVLPDDTHLSALTLHGRELVLVGDSAGASKLIGLLAARPEFNDPAFSAPVTRSESSNDDTFTITVGIRQPG